VEVRHLEYFVALAEELSFSRAAARVHIAQPSLSQQIRQIERELGTALIDRSARPIQLTLAGRRLLDDAHALLHQLDQTVRAVRRTGRGEREQLRVGYTFGGLYDLLLPVLRAFRAAHPDAGLLLREVPATDQARALRAGRVDVMVTRLTQPVADADLAVLSLRGELLAAVLPADHDLAARRRVPLRGLAGEAFVSFPRRQDPLTFDRYLQACLAAGFSPRVEHEVADAQSLALMVASGQGVALTGEDLSLRFAGVAYRRVDPPTEVATIVAIWLAHRPASLVQQLAELLAAEIATEEWRRPGPRAEP